MNEKGDNYFTIWYGVISLSEREIVYASAGHPPGIIINNQDPKYLDNKNIPIGMLDDYPFEQDIYSFNQGDSLYILSDGVYEVPQANGKLWGIDSLVRLITKYKDNEDFTLAKIWQFVKKQHKDRVLDDDFSLLKITF